MKGLTLSVTQLNEYVRKSLASDPMLRTICLRGEISNFKQHVSGHWYFTLKDAEASINCAMFHQAVMTVRFRPQNGEQVRLFGSVGLYAKTGSYQFYADAMECDGLGELFLRFEVLKDRLAAEGLFDASLKKKLPFLPRGIGIITSKTGAVVHDITRIAWRRNPCMPLYLCPANVQGAGAAAEIVKGIRLLDKLPEVDVIIVGRGGGSMEDLWAFNEETVARAIAKCGKPIVSAVGHETDFTIADFVADLRAPTPSAAAELAVPELDAVRGTIWQLTGRMARSFESAWSDKRWQLTTLEHRLSKHSPSQYSEHMFSNVCAVTARIESQMGTQLRAREHALNSAVLRLRTSGPVDSIHRGYAIITKQGRPVRNIDALEPGDELRLLLSGGSAEVTVSGIEEGEGTWLPKL